MTFFLPESHDALAISLSFPLSHYVLTRAIISYSWIAQRQNKPKNYPLFRQHTIRLNRQYCLYCLNTMKYLFCMSTLHWLIKKNFNHSLILTCVCLCSSSLFTFTTTQQPVHSTDSFTCLLSKNRRLFGFCPPAICISIPSNISNYHFTIFVMESNPLVLSNNNNNSYYKWKIAASPSMQCTSKHMYSQTNLITIKNTFGAERKIERDIHFRVSEKSKSHYSSLLSIHTWKRTYSYRHNIFNAIINVNRMLICIPCQPWNMIFGQPVCFSLHIWLSCN